MTHPRPVFSAAHALRSTFLAPIQVQCRRPFFKRIEIFQPRRLLSYASSPTRRLDLRPFQGTVPEDIPKSPPPRAPVDEAIKSDWVNLVDEYGDMSAPIPLQIVLRSIDRVEYCVVTLRPGRESFKNPICKVMAKRAYRELIYEQSRPKKPKSGGKDVKKIELNWAIDPNDLEIRMNQMESFLSKGKKVEVVLLHKKRKRHATPEEAEKSLAVIKKRIEEVATQSKPVQGKILERMQFSLEAKKQK